MCFKSENLQDCTVQYISTMPMVSLRQTSFKGLYKYH